MTIFIGILLIPVIMAVGVGAMIFEILAGIAASRGEWDRYPINIRLV